MGNRQHKGTTDLEVVSGEEGEVTFRFGSDDTWPSIKGDLLIAKQRFFTHAFLFVESQWKVPWRVLGAKECLFKTRIQS
jgi:hypothetical protein